MTNPTNLSDSVFLELAARADRLPHARNAWRVAAHSWGMDTYRARYFGREMACWEMLTGGADPDTAYRVTGVEPFTMERQLGLMSSE